MLPMYVMVSTLLLAVLGVVWSAKDFYNIVMKLVILATSILGLLVWLELAGYIIRK